MCQKAFYEGIKQAKPGNRVGDISAAIQKYVESYGYNVSRDFTGHGIGKSMHEDPSVPNYGIAGTGPIIKKGMALAIEPMILEGKKETRVLGVTSLIFIYIGATPGSELISTLRSELPNVVA